MRPNEHFLRGFTSELEKSAISRSKALEAVVGRAAPNFPGVARSDLANIALGGGAMVGQPTKALSGPAARTRATGYFLENLKRNLEWHQPGKAMKKK